MVRIDGKPQRGWVKNEDLFTSVKKLVDYHKKYPLGFGFYYWGDLFHKAKVVDETKQA
jgi:hypothetical protein